MDFVELDIHLHALRGTYPAMVASFVRHDMIRCSDIEQEEKTKQNKFVYRRHG